MLAGLLALATASAFAGVSDLLKVGPNDSVLEVGLGGDK
jgi:hypothetical protein